ncbi:MAG TPA: prolyl oligopeptidase family serine peptidase [Burkholderiaceae bacterium]|nr:prolyl oligopeptidase family serine peptidase [Burkholderiaceae bacterium]
MRVRRAAPYGAWPSPLGAQAVAAASLGLSYVTADAGVLYWVESRPFERGRNVVMAQPGSGTAIEASPPESNVRSRVHEYGGRPYVIVDGELVYSEFADQRLRLAGSPEPLTAESMRYADGAALGRQVFLVREDHSAQGQGVEPVNAIVVIDLDSPRTERVLYDQSDFVAYPRPSRDGRLAFVAWDHPNMPWDGTSLYVGRLRDGELADLCVVAGAADGPAESVLEPVWDEDGTLYFLSDRSGYWNLYRWRGERVERVVDIAADFGGPLWVLGLTSYALTGDGRALARICRAGVDALVLVDLVSGRAEAVDLPFRAFSSIGVLDRNTGYAVAAADDAPAAVVTIDLDNARHRVVCSAGPALLDSAYISRAEAIEFPTQPGPDGAPRTAHAFFHAPCSPDCDGSQGTLPPLIVMLHGGPTSHSTTALSAPIQFWTTRGFAVVNVNYGGSTGFGRAYRERLRGQWGVIDLGDAVAAVDFLVATKRVDGSKVAIRGGSAGGYTVLAGLAFTQRFAAGINYFGVSDLEALAADTHKFESRYLDTLIAPLPEGREIYRARSPIHHLGTMVGALITFQGDEDRAVPPQQSRAIVTAVRARGQPVSYIEFSGEQHGFRQAANIARALEAELYFLGRIFGFVPADAIEPVPIDNLPSTVG